MNNVVLEGIIARDFVLDHDINMVKMYSSEIKVMRKSYTEDTIQIIVPGSVLERIDSPYGYVRIEGTYRSFNKESEGKTHLCLYVFVDSICPIKHCDFTNLIELSGYICKEPIYRSTPKGRIICDILLHVPHEYGSSDYIPCVVWGVNARYCANLPVGSFLSLKGRVQSREYTKDAEIKIAYEVSVNSIKKNMVDAC